MTKLLVCYFFVFQAQKAILDQELDLITHQNTGEDTTELMKKMEELKQEVLGCSKNRDVAISCVHTSNNSCSFQVPGYYEVVASYWLTCFSLIEKDHLGNWSL